MAVRQRYVFRVLGGRGSRAKADGIYLFPKKVDRQAGRFKTPCTSKVAAPQVQDQKQKHPPPGAGSTNQSQLSKSQCLQSHNQHRRCKTGNKSTNSQAPAAQISLASRLSKSQCLQSHNQHRRCKTGNKSTNSQAPAAQISLASRLSKSQCLQSIHNPRHLLKRRLIFDYILFRSLLKGLHGNCIPFLVR